MEWKIRNLSWDFKTQQKQTNKKKHWVRDSLVGGNALLNKEVRGNWPDCNHSMVKVIEHLFVIPPSWFYDFMHFAAATWLDN